MRRFLAFVLLGGLALAQEPAPAAAPSAHQLTSDAAVTAHPPLPELPPLPVGKATRIGGTISSLDRVRDTFAIEPFGAGQVRIVFDPRTRIDRDGLKVSPRDLRDGQRVSLDTVLDGTQIFARNIHILAQWPQGESRGQVLDYETDKDELLLRDAISPQTVRLKFAPYTVVLRDGRAVSRQQLRPGTLVAVQFLSDSEGRAFARQVSILAMPGKDFVFWGLLTHLDLRTGLLVVTDPRSQKTYEIHFDPNVLPVPSNLRQGAHVTITANFEGSRYVATALTVDSSARP